MPPVVELSQTQVSRRIGDKGESLTRASEQIADDLSRLGIERGDTLLAKADVRYMRLKRDKSERLDYADALRDGLLLALGREGTLLVMTFTQTLTLGPFMRRPPFTRYLPANTGGLANSVLRHQDAIRSAHPTNSFAAIGIRAESLTRFHTPYAHTMRPVEDLVTVKGKMLTLGCVDTNPGFNTAHLAQHHLGLSARNLLAGHARAKYRKPSGKVAHFVKRDIPGCSMGFGNLYPLYRQAGLLIEGEVARARSYLISAPDAYEVDVRAIEADPLSVLCSDPDCIDCRVFKTYAPPGRASVVARRLRRQGGAYVKSLTERGE